MEEKFQQITTLLEERLYDDAEKLLLELKNEDYNNTAIDFYLGILYSKYDNPKKSDEKSKKHFQNVINGEYVYEYAFIFLAGKEENKNHSLRLIKKGLEVFPDSFELNKRLLIQSNIKEKEEIYQEITKKGICSNEIYNYMFSYYYGLGKYQDAYDIAIKMNVESKDFFLLIELAKGFCSYRINDISKAKSIFTFLIEEDINQELDVAPFIGAVLCNLKQGEINKGFELFDEIPFDYAISAELYSYPEFTFSFETELLGFFQELENNTKNPNILAKIKGLRGIYLSNVDDKKNEKRVIKDLEYANRYLPNTFIYIETLKNIAESNDRNLDAFNYGLSLIKYTFEKNEKYLESEYFWGFINSSGLDDVLEMTNSLINIIQTDFLKNKIYSGAICEALIEKLYSLKRYNEILGIFKSFNTNLMKGDFLFEVAYSFSEKGDLNSAKEIYELYQKKHGDTNASLNNLGVIYRKQNDLHKAQEMFKKAVELKPDDKTALNNYENVTKLVVEQEKQEEEINKSAIVFNSENAWIKGKLISFSKQRNIDGFIVCPYRQLPQFLGVSEIKANELIKSFLEKKYVIKTADHNIDTNSSVYRINSKIVELIEELQLVNQRENELISIAENINIDQYNKFGFDEKLIKSLDKVVNPELKSMLERDLNENVIALITKSYKTSLIMSGSIIEAVLLDHITSKNITSYILENGKSKKTNQMDLNELLYIANKEAYIDLQLYHLSHAIRGFRNLIHPGVEKRKTSIIVNEENAALAWSIVKKVIQEI
ncbi:hypothetical protein BVG16_25300 [Paenibacillus selenitireducens]|uniref:Uncharacterized protein n=1 Tax=Paenibacillus selenitireducens TaxID=1324314 RepID=A0A1T2X2I4_9BACL|nr:tetratricopeptide repeat protein [Paenibacillus selenitireducens]OPA74070.1 hypothetical protein BVG16_25300 [Paenibacillus selenitireducens]